VPVRAKKLNIPSQEASVTETTQDRGSSTSLRGSSVSLFGGLAISVGYMGPTAGIAIIPAIMAGYIGDAGVVGFAVGLLLGLCIAYGFVLFTRHYAHAGSIYQYNGQMLGAAYGFVSVWVLFFAYTLSCAGTASQVASYVKATWSQTSGVPWLVFTFAALAIAVFLSARSIRLSAIFVAVIEGVGLLLVLIVGIAVLSSGGYHGTRLTSSLFDISGFPVHTVALGAILAFLGYTGFEAASTLSEETKHAFKNVPIAILASLVAGAIAYIYGDLIETAAFPNAHALASSSAPLLVATRNYLSPHLVPVLGAATVLSAFGAVVATLNGATRLLFALGRDGFISTRLGSVSTSKQTPTFALGVVTALATAIVLSLSTTSPGNAFSYLATLGTLAELAMYVATLVAAVRFLNRFARRSGLVRVLGTVVLVVGIGGTGYGLYTSVWPPPVAPLDILTYIAAAWLALGVGLIVARPQLRERLERSSLLHLEVAVSSSDPVVSEQLVP
jgi:amino acid transporter